MKARLYCERQLLAVLDVCAIQTPYGKRRLTPNDTITVVVTDDHPTPGQRPLFTESRLELA
jgi:hypothetical protein